jgi:S-adenosylmethionine decarboxylase
MSTKRGSTPDYLHLIVECRGCPPDRIDHRPTVRKALRMAAKACLLHVVQEGIHGFRPKGVTGYVLLKESHISVHTWPEHGFALVDVLSCVNLDREALVACFREWLRPAQVTVWGIGASRRHRWRRAR